MVTDRNKKRSPPYVSYRSFLTLLEELQRGVPAVIDRSYWGDKFSGSTGTQLMSALRFLNLVDANGSAYQPIERTGKRQRAAKSRNSEEDKPGILHFPGEQFFRVRKSHLCSTGRSV